MRRPRIKLIDSTAVYHCISRVVGGQFLLADPAKEQLRLMLWQQIEFCGLELITYAILSNHFHVLARVPQPCEVSDTELLRRAEALYAPQSAYLATLRQAMADQGRLSRSLRRRLLLRMGDISPFMKELKQRFSRWYNPQHDRFGTLWAERFKSVLVEDEPQSIGTVAAYIDLNSVRAGLVEDPKNYRFCGYAEALGGNPRAREGLLSFLGVKDWGQGAAEYRQRLFLDAERAGESGKVTLDREQILKVLAEGGAISCGEALRLRIRYLSDGLVLGSELYVNHVFRRFRNHFGPKRRAGARKLRRLPFVRLRTLRDLRICPVS